MTDLWTLTALLVIGMMLVGLEVTIFPGVGLPGLLGAGLLLAGCYLGWTGHGPMVGTGLFVLSVVVVGGLVWVGSKTSIGKRMVLEEQTLGSSAPVTDWEKRLGSRGITRSALRPSGVAEIDGSRLDVVATDGTWIDAGEAIVVVGVQTNSLLVERVSAGEDKGESDV